MIYAVNKRTKEHRVAERGSAWGAPWSLVAATPDGWIEHDRTGECPMPDDFRCDYRNARGSTQHDVAAGNVSWTYIIAYRPILGADSKPEPPTWTGEGLPPAGCECEFEHVEEGNWIAAKVIGYDGPACVVALDGFGYFGSDNPSDFRPIRSEEDRAVEEMTRAYEDAEEVAYPNGVRGIYKAIRDGKVPGVRLAAADREEK